MSGLIDFIRGTIEELKKVTWPTKKEAINSTIVVLIAVVFCSVLIWVVDTLLSIGFRLIMQ
ncbi:MAG: preprotein translocase subunit SecE [Acidaminococcaceae bacterium]|nr:preprotein translocase subunit SecE [Acidaminococcaceae bacterium]MDO4935318.1 preprotein translocase subunit SecE [Phascolarctobacterium sp.]